MADRSLTAFPEEEPPKKNQCPPPRRLFLGLSLDLKSLENKFMKDSFYFLATDF
jgi:hypothetical protein